MLAALSLLALSVSFLVYRNPPSTWLGLVIQLRQFAASLTAPTSEPHRPDGEPQHTQPHDRIKLEPESSSSSLAAAKAPSCDTSTALAPQVVILGEHEKEQEQEPESRNGSSDDNDDDDDLPPPSFPAWNSAQRASASSLSSSMPPPPPPPPKPTMRAPPYPPQSMLMPSAGLVPNRGPAPNRTPSTYSGTLALPRNAGPPVKTPNARGKVLLSPGHSPLDWANLQRSGQNLSGLDSLIRVTPAMLKERNGRKGKPAWSSYQGKVYNISPYLPFHPGGEGELRRAAGKDGTKLFMDVHPWVNWENMLAECMVGILVSQEQPMPKDAGTVSLEDMD